MSKKKLVAGAALVTLSAGLASQAQAATAIGNISAVVVKPISVNATQTMNFGSFSVTGAGAINLDSSGAVTARSGSTALGGTIQAGSFTVSADTRLMDVSFGAATVNVTHTTKLSKNMSVNAFEFRCTGTRWAVNATDVNTGQCSLANATQTGKIQTGATINYAAGQTPGTYTGTYQLVVTYN